MNMNISNPHANTAEYRRYAQRHFPALCRMRDPESHKGTFGTVGIIGGSEGMTGAPLLAGAAALYTGSGKVIVGFNQNSLPLPVFQPYPELMLDTGARLSVRRDIRTWVVGCGLGRNDTAARAMYEIWHSDAEQIVLDADALHLLVEQPRLFTPNRRSDLVLTPHPGEAAHLLDVGTDRVQQNRAWAARELASRHRCWVVLKGHDTVISSARGLIHTNPTGNAGLATAGSGDVLSGIVGSLLGQGIDAEQAVPAAAWLHGAASEILANRQTGPIGMLASEIAPTVRWLRNQIAIG